MRHLHTIVLALSLIAQSGEARAQTPAPASEAPPSPAPSEATAEPEAEADPGPPKSIRTLLVIDDPDGGGMTRKLSLSASMLYTSLANRTDAIGLYLASSRPVKLPPKPLTESKTFIDLRNTLGKVPDVRPAPFGAVAKYAREIFSDRGEGVRDAVVILGHSPRSGAHTPEIPKSAGRELAKLGVRVYFVGFGERTRPEDYASLVETTRGKAFKVTKGEELERAFSGIFTHLHDTEALPVVGDAIVMDDSIGEATVVVPKRNKKDRNHIVTPGDRVLSAKTKYPGVEWTSFADYDLIKIEKPEAGTWRVQQSSKAGGVVGHVNASDLRLRVTVGPRTPMVGDLTKFEAYLEREGRPVTSYAALKHLVVEAEVRDPAGRMRPLRLNRTNRGTFEGKIVNELQGYHEVRLTAFSPEVQRERRLTFLVNPGCFQGKFVDATGVVEIEMNHSCPRFAELYARLEVEHEGKTIHAQSFKRKGMKLTASGPRPDLGQDYRLNVVIEARTLDGHVVESDAGGPFEDSTRDPTLADYVKAIAKRLALLNIPIMVGMLGVVAVRQARRSARGPSLEEVMEEVQ